MGKFRVEPIIIYNFLGKILIISIKESLLPPYDSFILLRCLFFLLNFDCISVVYFIYRVPPFRPPIRVDKCNNSSAVLLRFRVLGKHDERRNRCAIDRFITLIIEPTIPTGF